VQELPGTDDCAAWELQLEKGLGAKKQPEGSVAKGDDALLRGSGACSIVT
jgi:hypothetical protein